jgi:hypothetical protein
MFVIAGRACPGLDPGTRNLNGNAFQENLEKNLQED